MYIDENIKNMGEITEYMKKYCIKPLIKTLHHQILS